MPEKEYIEREAIPLKKFIETARMFSDDIICAIGTNFMQNIAEAENKELFEIIKAIQTAPTADVAEVKHGEWVKHRPDPEAMRKWHELGIGKGMGENSIFWVCSCCGCWGTPRQKYCSECGAKMYEKEKDNAK